VAGLALVFLVAHLRALPQTLEGVDSINFALAVQSFDVAGHQPDPPGDPLYVGLARVSTAAVGTLKPGWDRDRRAAVGLAIPGVVAGTLALWVLTAFWIAIGLSPVLACLAAMVAVASPLFWFTAARPLNDAPGLVAALAVATCLIAGLRQIRDGAAGTPRVWIAGAFGAGLIGGLQSQTMWLTGLLLAWAIGELLARRRVRGVAAVLGAAAAGLICWVVPLLIVGGGLRGYLLALGGQGTQDLAGVEMLATSPTWAMLKLSLGRTFVDAWQAGALANIVLSLAAVGAGWLAVRRRRVLAAIVLTFWPYLVFHLMFHGTGTIRYDLPLVIPVAGLAVVGLSLVRIRLATVAASVIALASLVVVQPRLEAHATLGAPAFRGFQEMRQALDAETVPPVLLMQPQVWSGVRRTIDWYRPVWAIGDQSFAGDQEWLAVERQLLTGAQAHVWFLTDPARTDVQFLDRRSRRRRGRYELSPGIRELVGGARLDGFAWWDIRTPFWMLGRGWAVTPEVRGTAAADRTGPELQPAVAYLRRQPGPTRVMIGGRDLADVDWPAARVTVQLDGRAIGEWETGPDRPSFLEWLDVPDTSGPGPYARLTVGTQSATGDRSAPLVALEQFDAAPDTDFIAAMGAGFYELGEDPRTGRFWRWMADRAELDVQGVFADARLTIGGESPLNYFGRPPVVIVRAGDREIGRFRPAGDFLETLNVPVSALVASGGRLSIETDLSFVPAERGYSQDKRRLGLRLFQVQLDRE
jgi:hypothetical protein